MRKFDFDEVVATFFGLGRVSKMPGTLTSAVACAIGILIKVNWMDIAVVAAIGYLCADRYAKKINGNDPPEVVIDEVLGMWIAMCYLPISYALPAFVLFRIVDILKPFPINLLEKLPGGLGIMADDAAAGALVRLILWGIHVYFIGTNII